MKELIYLVSLGALYILGRLFRTKKDRVSAVFACLILILIMGGQTDNPDYIIYRNIYMGPFYSKDPGFGLVLEMLKGLGFTPDNFRVGIAIIGLLLISVTVFRLVNVRLFFYLIYGIYPFLFDVVQARNFLVMSLLIFAVPFLLNQTFRGNLTFLLLMIFAVLIQKVAIVYLPLVFLQSSMNRINRKYFFRGIILTAIIFALNKGMLIQLLNHIAESSDQVSELSNYAMTNTRFGWIVFWAEQFFAYMIANYANSIEQDYSDLRAESMTPVQAWQSKFVTLMLNVNLYAFIFLPLFILDENYTRIIRNLLPLNLLSVLIVCSAHGSRIFLTKKRLLLLFYEVTYSGVMFYLMSRSYWDTIIIPTFNSNWLW